MFEDESTAASALDKLGISLAEPPEKPFETKDAENPTTEAKAELGRGPIADEEYARQMERRATLGSLRKKRQLDADFLRDIADPSVASDNEKLFQRCNQYVADRYVSAHNNGNVLNGMEPFTDAQAYASTLTALIKEGGDPAAFSTEQFRAVRDAYVAGNRDELCRVLNISKTKVDSQVQGGGTFAGMAAPVLADKTPEELDEEIADGVNRVMSQNYLHLYNMMRPELTAKGAWLVDKTIKTGKFDPEDLSTFLEIERNDKEEGRSVMFLIQAARPTRQNWWVDMGHEVWYLSKDMIEGAFRKFGEPLQAILDRDVTWDLAKEAAEAHHQRVEGGMSEEESQRILDAEVASIKAEALLEPRTRNELRREKLVLDEFTRHKPWEGYGFLKRSLMGAATTLPYMGMTAVPGVGFVFNVSSHMQDVEDDIIRNGGDPEQAKAFRLISAVMWAAIEKTQFEGLFGKALTRMEKRALWLEGSRRAYGQLAMAYTKEWTAKEISETVEEGLQGGLQALETDLGLVGNSDPEKRKSFNDIVNDAVDGFVNDMKESAGSMGILALVGTGKAVHQESRRQYRAGIDGESLNEFFLRRDRVDTVIDGSWAEGDGDKVERRKKVFNKLIDLWAKAGREKTPLGEVAAQIEEQFGFTEEQARTVVNFLESRDTLTEMAVGLYRDAADPRSAAQQFVDEQLSGGEFQFIVGNDGTFDVGRLFQFFPGVEVETVDVDADGQPIDTTAEAEQPAFEEDARLAGLRAELAQLEQAIAAAPNRKARRPLELQHRKVERKIRNIERQDEQKKAERKPVERPKAAGQQIRITQTIKDADGNDTQKTWVLQVDHGVPDITAPDFATSVANEAVRAGMPVEYNGGQTVITADNQAEFTDWLRNFIATDKELATSWLKAHGFTTGGNFEPAADPSAGVVGTIRMLRGNSPLVRKGGNYTLSHEFFHAFTAAADQMGLLTDELVGTFRQAFGEPRGANEKFNEEAAADAFRDWLRGELDFAHIAEDRRGLVEKLIDGVFGAFRDIYTGLTGKKPLTPAERVTLRDAQIAAFEAVRNGDLRGMSKFAGIDFTEDRKQAEKGKAEAEARARKAEEEAKNGKKGPTVGFRRKGIRPPEDESADEEVSNVEPTVAAAEAVASAAPGSVPVRTGSKRKVFTPNYAMSVDTELAWVSLEDLVESTDDRDIQMRDRSRASSTEQVHNISKPRRRLADGTYEGFAPEGLLPSDTSDRGSPIIGGGGHVISGHGRYRVLNALAQAGRFGEYLAAAQQYAADAGIAQAPAGMSHPVLVHRITSALSREQLVKFADFSNKSGLLQMSLAGNAENDARKLTPNMMRLYNPGANGYLLSASNRPFMLAFLRAVGAEDSLMNADKTKILPEAATRVQRALMVALFGNDEAVRPMMQYLIETAADVSLGTLSRTLMANAGQLLAMKGQHGSMSIVPAVASAAKLYVAWRAAQSSAPGMSFGDYLHTDDLFEAHASPLDTAVALLLETPYFDRVLRKYGELVANEADDNQGLLGISGAERHSSVQLLAMAERAVVDKDAAGNPVTPYVTLDPADPSYALEEQTPPAVSAAPAPEPAETPAPVQAAAAVLNPPADATFTPTAVVRGTAQLPNRGAQGIQAHQVNADGNATTAPRQLPAGAWNYLRGPYDVKHPPRTGSAQDRGGRGLGIANPPVALDDQGRCWNRIFPHFQGNKTEMADRTSQAIRNNMTKAERGHYRTLVDYFGGGGCWGLYHALTNFPNVKNLVINEWEAGRLAKIRLLHELDGAVADMAREILIGTRERYEKTYRACLLDNGQETGSGATIANKVTAILDELLDGRGEDARGVLFAFIDCAHTMLTNRAGEDGAPSFDAGVEAVLANLKEDGRKAKEAADALKARGGSITYRQGDAAAFDDAPHGDNVMAVCDPPYYLTAGYNGQVSVPLDTDMGWSYRTTQRLLDGLVDSGDGIIYTDEAWWHKEGYTPDQQADMFSGGRSTFDQEQEVLLGIINSLDHFDVAGRVAGRQEVLGVHHGHTVDRSTLDGQAEVGADGRDVRPDVPGQGADASGIGNVRSSVRRVGRGAEGEDRTARADHRGGRRGGYADRVIARETCVQAIVDAIDGAYPHADAATLGRLARFSVRQVREDKMAAYAATVSKNAKAWLRRQAKELDKRMAAAGYTEKVWHGTGAGQFQVFRLATRDEGVNSIGGYADDGIRMAFFSYQESTASNYAALSSYDVDTDYEELAEGARPDVRQYYVNPGKTLRIDSEDWPMNYEEWTQTLRKAWKEGYDSIVCTNAIDDQGARLPSEDGAPMEWADTEGLVNGKAYNEDDAGFPTDIIVVFDHGPKNPGSNRIKAADPVTFWDEEHGELPIPLEMRANGDFPDLRFSVQMGKRAKEEARQMIAKYRPGIHGYLTNYNGKMMHEDDAAIEAIAAFDTPKERKAALYWFCKDTVRLPEDSAKIVEAIKTAERAKVDPFQFERPGEILTQYADYRPTEPPTDPDTVPELSDRRERGRGIVTYLVQDDKAGQAAMRRIINTHFGKDASPWCLLHGDGKGGLADDAWYYWNNYNALPKRVAFKDGKLVAFMATDRSPQRDYLFETGNYALSGNGRGLTKAYKEWLKTHNVEEWWDRNDEPHRGVPFTEKDAEGRTSVLEMDADGEVTLFSMSRGDPKRDGTYEVWEPGAVPIGRYHRVYERQGGRVVSEREYFQDGSPYSETFTPSRDRSYRRVFSRSGQLLSVNVEHEDGYAVVSGGYAGAGLEVRLRSGSDYEKLKQNPATGEVAYERHHSNEEGVVVRQVMKFDGTGRCTSLSSDRYGVELPAKTVPELYIPPITKDGMTSLVEAAWADGQSLPAHLYTLMSPRQPSRSSVRFSVRAGDVQPVTKDEFESIVRKHGKYDDPKFGLSTWLFPSGEMPRPSVTLLLGGKLRAADHSAFVDDLVRDRSAGDAFVYGYADFLVGGAIRINASEGLEVCREPTEEQYDAIWDYLYDALDAQKDAGEASIVVDFDDPSTSATVHSAEYRVETAPGRIVSDIKGWFKDGMAPSGNPPASTRWSVRQANGLNRVNVEPVVWHQGGVDADGNWDQNWYGTRYDHKPWGVSDLRPSRKFDDFERMAAERTNNYRLFERDANGDLVHRNADIVVGEGGLSLRPGPSNTRTLLDGVAKFANRNWTADSLMAFGEMQDVLSLLASAPSEKLRAFDRRRLLTAVYDHTETHDFNGMLRALHDMDAVDALYLTPDGRSFAGFDTSKVSEKDVAFLNEKRTASYTASRDVLERLIRPELNERIAPAVLEALGDDYDKATFLIETFKDGNSYRLCGTARATYLMLNERMRHVLGARYNTTTWRGFAREDGGFRFLGEIGKGPIVVVMHDLGDAVDAVKITQKLKSFHDRRVICVSAMASKGDQVKVTDTWLRSAANNAKLTPTSNKDISNASEGQGVSRFDQLGSEFGGGSPVQLGYAGGMRRDGGVDSGTPGPGLRGGGSALGAGTRAIRQFASGRGNSTDPVTAASFRSGLSRFSVRSVGPYSGEYRQLAHGLKLGNFNAITRAAAMMAEIVPDNAVLVPMPNHEGAPIRTTLLAQAISGVKDGLDVVPALGSNAHETSYHQKKRGAQVGCIEMFRTDAEIPAGRPVVIVDNVVASGATYAAAKKVLPNADLVTLADADRRYSQRRAQAESDLAAARFSVRTAYSDKGRYSEDWLEGAAEKGDMTAIAEWFDRRWNALTARVRKHRIGPEDTWDLIANIRATCFAKFASDRNRPKYGFGKFVYGAVDNLVLDTVNGMKGGVGTREKLVLDEAAHDNDKNGESREDRIDLVAAPAYDHDKDAARQRVDEFLSHYTGQRREIFEEVKLDGKDVNMLAKAYGVSVGEINTLCDAMVAEWVSGAYKTRSTADDEPFKRPADDGADSAPKSRIVSDWKNGTIDWGPAELRKRPGVRKRHRAEVPEQVERVFRLATAYPEATTKELAAVLGVAAPRIPEAIRRGVEKCGFADPRQNGRKLRPRASRYSVRMGGNRRGYNAEDLVKGYTAAKILAGKEVKPEDVDQLAKMLGKPDLVAADVLAAARATAERKTRSASFKARAADATLMSDLADEALRERVGNQIDNAIVTGAGITDPDVGAAVQEAANRYAARSLDAAKGFTAREMEQKLPISLADAIFAEAEYERSPEEQAKLDELKRQRDEEREAEKKAAEELGMSLAEYRLMQAEREEDGTVYVEPSPEQKAYLAEIMDRARMRKELNDADEARRQASRKRQRGEGDGEGEAGEGGEEAILPKTLMRRIAPVFGSADMFALFLTEWCADEIVRKHPEIPNTDQMWRNRTAIKELVRTAQNILGDLASDVLGRPSVNAERNYADRAILGLAERKSYRGILSEIAYIYDMIHDRALKMSRRTLIRDLVKDIRTKAAVKGRFKATTEKNQRGIDARTELWARHLLPVIQMNEEQLAAEKARLTAIVNEYNRDSAENGYEADNFQEYRDACDKLALMEKYGAMKTWMPSRIIQAAQEIRDELNGRRAEFEAYRLRRDEENERIRTALVKAMEAGGTEAYRKAAGSLVKAMGRYGASLNGNLTLEMRNLIRYCKDEEARKAALEAIDELAIVIGRASETYRVTLGTAHKEVNEGLAQIYGSAEKALKHLLEEKIPEEVAVRIFKQSRQELPTYGQLLQLYASCLQADYKDNLEKHGRADQLELMKATLTDQDLQLHAWAIDWYANNRQALSDAVDAITGLSVASPDRLYCPVRVLREPSGFPVEALAWSPVPSALNRRVSHGLDFDERYNFLTLLQEQCEVRAQLVGYGEAGIRLRDTIAHHDVQAAAAKYVSRADIKAVTDHVRDVLTQGIEARSSDAFFKPLNVARKWIARFYLSGNLPSAIKQLASRPVWANEVGFRKAAEYYLSAFTPEGWARVRELVDTDGYRARYMLGWSEETQNIIRNPSKNAVLKYLGKFYDAGMWLNKGVDMLSCLWMAQGFYGDAKQRFLDLGFSEEDAKAKAAALTWSVCENGQQSGRIENLNRVQREHPESAGALLQFMTAYLLQNNYEIQAAKECYAGTPGAKGRLLRAIVINHVLIPGFVAMVEMAWHAIMGVEPPEDPEEWSQYTKDLVYSMALGPAAPLYMWSQIGTGIYDKLTGRKRKGQARHTTPAEGILEIGDKIGTLIYNAGKYGLQEFTALDFEEELTVEKLQDDLLRAASAVYAPARHIIKAIKNRQE